MQSGTRIWKGRCSGAQRFSGSLLLAQLPIVPVCSFIYLFVSFCSSLFLCVQCPSCADVLKSLMWRYRSSLTNKHALRPGSDAQDAPDPAAERMFQQIKGEIDQAAKRIIAGRIQYG